MVQPEESVVAIGNTADVEDMPTNDTITPKLLTSTEEMEDITVTSNNEDKVEVSARLDAGTQEKEAIEETGEIESKVEPEPASTVLHPSDEDHTKPGDPTIHVKVMSIAPAEDSSSKSTPHPKLDRYDYTQRSIRSGTLKVHIATSNFFYGKSRSWKKRFVFIDETDGIIICTDREAFQRGDRKSYRNLPFSDIAGVILKHPEDDIERKAALTHCRFVVYVKPRAQPIFGPELELETPEGIQDAEEWVRALKQKILVKARVYTVGLNGEFPEHARGVGHNIAICFSGGGGRAHVAACGQLRALHHLGLLHKKNVDYISGVSAGAWATSIYMFYERGAKNDDELLGELTSTNLRTWTMGALDNTELAPILRPALESCMKVASELVWKVNSHQLWERVMGKIFLKPFGLNKEWPFALREDVEHIKRENPHLRNTRFCVQRTSDRPFWICHGTIIGPQWAKLGDLLPIQFTPLYSGSPYLHKIRYQQKGVDGKRREEVVWVGGGMVDSYAFGGDEPSASIDAPPVVRTVTEEPSSSGLISSFRNYFWPKQTSSQDLLPPEAQEPEVGREVSAGELLAPRQFENLVHDQIEELSEKEQEVVLKTRSMPKYSSDMLDAMSTLNLAPSMVQRVFRHAQDALKSHTFYSRRPNEQVTEKIEEYVGALEKEVSLPYPEVPFSLRHALGISSDAPGVNLHEKSTFKRLNVQERYWSPVYVATDSDSMLPSSENQTKEFNMSQNIATTKAMTMDMGDGGSLDNLGICGMLQRGVRRIVVFCNTNNLVPPAGWRNDNKNSRRQSLKLDFDAYRRVSMHLREPLEMNQGAPPPSPNRRNSVTYSIPLPRNPEEAIERLRKASMANMSDNDDNPPTFEEWSDDDILPLFGQTVDEESLNYLGTHHSNNHCFPISELRPLLRRFQECLMTGKPLVVRETHEVIDNPFWGIVGGWTVEVLWCYLDDSTIFRSSLAEDTIQELEKGKGEFARFPNFRTFGNNSSLSFDIALTRRQAQLLSTFTEWQVMYNKDLFTDFITSPLPEYKPKKKRPEPPISQLEMEGFC